MASTTGKTAGSKKDSSTLRVRKLDGKLVKIILYNGRAVGLGSYFAGTIDGEMVLDKNGVPRHYRDIGQLERP